MCEEILWRACITNNDKSHAALKPILGACMPIRLKRDRRSERKMMHALASAISTPSSDRRFEQAGQDLTSDPPLRP